MILTLVWMLLQAKPAENPLIREEQTLRVNGIEETWRLVWKHPPRPFCQDETSCPCEGFSYGEQGHLDLVRLQTGHEIDRLSLGQFFGGGFSPVLKGAAALPRWPALLKDIGAMESKGFAARIRKRPVTKIMEIGDYDHDGEAAEFVLQVDAGPCGHRTAIVVGVSKKNPRLHAFGTAQHPQDPLGLDPAVWRNLLKSATGHIRAVTIACGDHGIDTEVRMELSAKPAGIAAVSSFYECDANNKPGRRTGGKPF